MNGDCPGIIKYTTLHSQTLKQPAGEGPYWLCAALYFHAHRWLCTQQRGYQQHNVTEESNETMKEEIHRREHQLVYITPELLICNAGWRKMLVEEGYTEHLVADEAHAVKL